MMDRLWVILKVFLSDLCCPNHLLEQMFLFLYKKKPEAKKNVLPQKTKKDDDEASTFNTDR